MSGCCCDDPYAGGGGGGGASPAAPVDSVQFNDAGAFGGNAAFRFYLVGPDEAVVALKARLGFGGGTQLAWFDSGDNVRGYARYIPDDDLMRFYGENLHISTGAAEPIIETENAANVYKLPQYGGAPGDVLMGYDTGPIAGSRFNASLNFSESPAGRDRLQILGDGGNDAFATFAPNGVEKGAIGWNVADSRLELHADGYVYQWPDADGNPGDVMVTDGAGVLSFVAPSGGSSGFFLGDGFGRNQRVNASGTSVSNGQQSVKWICPADMRIVGAYFRLLSIFGPAPNVYWAIYRVSDGALMGGQWHALNPPGVGWLWVPAQSVVDLVEGEEYWIFGHTQGSMATDSNTGQCAVNNFAAPNQAPFSASVLGANVAPPICLKGTYL